MADHGGGTERRSNSNDPKKQKTRLPVRAFGRLGRNRPLLGAAALGLILAAVGFIWLCRVVQRCTTLHVAAQFAGSDDRFVWLAPRCAVSAATWQVLVPDLVFIVGYWLMCTAILIGGWWRYEAPALRRASWVLWLPTVVAVADLAEDALLAVLLYKREPGRFGLRGDGVLHIHGDFYGFLDWALLTAAWTKWIAAAAMVIAVVMAAAIWFSRRAVPYPPVEPETAPPHRRSRDLGWTDDTKYDPEKQRLTKVRAKAAGAGASAAKPQRVGICLSGGGIRSAAFCLGVLSELEADSDVGNAPGNSARYLAGVSGGAWAAAVWTLQKANQPTAAANAAIKGLKAETESAGYPRQNYLMNSRGGILGALGWVLLSSLTNLALIALLVYVVAWPLGWAMGHCIIDSGRLGAGHCGPALLHRAAPTPVPDARLYVPSIVFLVIGVLWLLVCGFMNRRGAKTWPMAAALLVLSFLSAAYLIWIPAFFALGGDVKAAITAAIGSAIGGSVFAGIGGALWKLVGGPLVHEVTGVISRALPRLLGILLLLGGLGWALVVMYVVSTKSTITWVIMRWKIVIPISSWWALVIPMAVLLVMYVFLGPNWPTLHNIFSARLQRSFDPVVNPFNAATGSRGEAGTWAWLDAKTVGSNEKSDPTGPVVAGVPELILCCAQQRNGIAAGGLRAETFTISPRFVRQGGSRSCETPDYIDTARHVKRFAYGPLEFGHLEYVSTWLATTGAAFSSAMGRMSLGSTNAFMAAVNADLGIWLPNLTMLQEEGVLCPKTKKGTANEATNGASVKALPRPRFAYILKEILGWYDTHDRFVFITDGGHWDNLGLVELLRRDCDVIYCVDASGDPPGSFATLSQALELAALELGCKTEPVDLEEDFLKGMRPTKTGVLPAKLAATFTIERSAGSDGAAGSAPGQVTIHYMKLQSAQAMSPDLKRWAIADPKFPHYSTMRQFLTNDQFLKLVELGREAGAAALGRDEPVGRPRDEDGGQ